EPDRRSTAPYDREKLLRRSAAFGATGFVRRQVSRDDGGKVPWMGRNELHSAAQVLSCIHLLGLSQKWIAPCSIGRICVAIVACPCGVNQIAAQAHPRSVFAPQVQ